MFTTVAFVALGVALLATPFVAAVSFVLRPAPQPSVPGIEVTELDVEVITL